MFRARDAEADEHHVVFGRCAVFIQPRGAGVQRNFRRDVERNDAGGDGRNGRRPRHAVQGQEAVEEGQAIPVFEIGQLRCTDAVATNAVIVAVKVQSCGFKRRWVLQH